MTNQELDNLDKVLAEQVMEYKEQKYEVWGNSVKSWFTAYGTRVRDSWTPTRNIEQAMLVAEKIGGLILHNLRDKTWICNFWESPIRTEKTPALAICLAAKAWLDAKEAK